MAEELKTGDQTVHFSASESEDSKGKQPSEAPFYPFITEEENVFYFQSEQSGLGIEMLKSDSALSEASAKPKRTDVIDKLIYGAYNFDHSNILIDGSYFAETCDKYKANITPSLIFPIHQDNGDNFKSSELNAMKNALAKRSRKTDLPTKPVAQDLKRKRTQVKTACSNLLNNLSKLSKIV